MAIQYKITGALKIANNPCNTKLAKKYCNNLEVWNPKFKKDENKSYIEFYINWLYHGKCQLNSEDYQNCAMKLNQVGYLWSF